MRELAAAVIAALSIVAGTATTQPAEGDTADTAAIVEIDTGALVVEDDALKVKAADGTVAAGTLLKFRLEDFDSPSPQPFPAARDLDPQLSRDRAV